jgi:Tfp pilus assembly PilM family ATPase
MLQDNKEPQYLLGIAWYPQLVKLAVIRKKGRKKEIIGLEHLVLDSDSPADLGEVVSAWIQANLPPNASVEAVLSLPESAIFLKEFTVPSADPEVINTAIHWEIPTLTPLTPHQAVYQWQVITTTPEKTTIAVMIIKDELAQQLYHSIAQHQINLVAIEPFTVSFTHLTTSNLKPSTLLMSVDQGEVNYVVLKNGLPVFSTSGGANITKHAQGSRSLASESVRALAESAATAIAFWQEQGEGDISQVVITGDVAKYYGLATAIYKQTKIPAFMAKSKHLPLAKNSKLSNAAYQRFLIPAGAAYRASFQHDPKTVNLLPHKEKALRAAALSTLLRQRLLSGFASVNSGLALFLLILLIAASFFGASLNRDLDQTRRFVENHPGQVHLASIQTANLTFKTVNTLVNQQKDQGERLRQIATLTPNTLSLKTIAFAGKKQDEWRLEGSGDRDAILAFYENVSQNAGAISVTLTYSSLQKLKDAHFVLEVIWQ